MAGDGYGPAKGARRGQSEREREKERQRGAGVASDKRTRRRRLGKRINVALSSVSRRAWANVVHITRDADADADRRRLLQCGDVGILIENAASRSRDTASSTANHFSLLRSSIRGLLMNVNVVGEARRSF